MTRMRRAAAIMTLGTVGALAGMTAASAGGGCHSGVTEGYGTRIEMIDACFTPTTLFAEPGETITFVSRDADAHNMTANAWGHFDDMHEGERFTTSFKTDGIYAYACTYHPGMTGAIVDRRGRSRRGHRARACDRIGRTRIDRGRLDRSRCDRAADGCRGRRRPRERAPPRDGHLKTCRAMNLRRAAAYLPVASPVRSRGGWKPPGRRPRP